MESYASRDGQEEPPAPAEGLPRVPDRHIITLAMSSLRKGSDAPVHGDLEVRPGDQLIWEVEVPSGSTVGLGLQLPAGAPVRSFGPFAVFDVNIVDLDGVNRKVEIIADEGDFPEPSLSVHFAMLVLERPETPALQQAEQTAALMTEDPVDPDTSLKIDKMSRPPDAKPGGGRKKFPHFGEGRWQKVLVNVAAASEVSLWIDPDPPSGGSNP